MDLESTPQKEIIPETVIRQIAFNEPTHSVLIVFSDPYLIFRSGGQEVYRLMLPITVSKNKHGLPVMVEGPTGKAAFLSYDSAVGVLGEVEGPDNLGRTFDWQNAPNPEHPFRRSTHEGRIAFEDILVPNDDVYMNVSGEEYRVYHKTNGEQARIDSPIACRIRHDGAHQVIDAFGESHYFVSGSFNQITFRARPGFPHFF